MVYSNTDYFKDSILPLYQVLLKKLLEKVNADKDMMYKTFVKETKIDLKKLFDTEKVGNPISDIVDSYFIQKVGYDNHSRSPQKYLRKISGFPLK